MRIQILLFFTGGMLSGGLCYKLSDPYAYSCDHQIKDLTELNRVLRDRDSILRICDSVRVELIKTSEDMRLVQENFGIKPSIALPKLKLQINH